LVKNREEASHGPTEVYPLAHSLVEGIPCGAAATFGPGNRNPFAAAAEWIR